MTRASGVLCGASSLLLQSMTTISLKFSVSPFFQNHSCLEETPELILTSALQLVALGSIRDGLLSPMSLIRSQNRAEKELLKAAGPIELSSDSRVLKFPNMGYSGFYIGSRNYGLGRDASCLGTWTLRSWLTW